MGPKKVKKTKKQIEEDIKYLKSGTKKIAALAVSTDTGLDGLRADKRLVLYVTQDLKAEIKKLYTKHHEAVAERKKKELQRLEKAEADDVLDPRIS